MEKNNANNVMLSIIPVSCALEDNSVVDTNSTYLK